MTLIGLFFFFDTCAEPQLIMREFNAYIKDTSRDAVLIAATIQAIGRVAAWLPSLTVCATHIYILIIS